MSQSISHRNFLYLPLLHLCVCVIIALARLSSGWEYLTKVDFPISVFIVSAMYSFDHPLILFGIIGTFWWYLLSRAAEMLWTKFSNK
jgi:hypothetical protein